MSNSLEKAMYEGNVTESERVVLSYIHGILGVKPKPAVKIGQLMGISESKVKSIAKVASFKTLMASRYMSSKERCEVFSALNK